MEPSTGTLSKIEVLPVRGGRRRWPDEVKARIVAETLEPGATVRGVAQRYDVHSNQLTGWSRLARDGRLVLPSLDTDMAFVPLAVSTEGSGVSAVVGERVEVVLERVTVRLDAAVPACRLAEIVTALNAASS